MENTDFDCIIIGAGVVGLAIACEAAQNGQRVLILEKEGQFGTHTSSRNSEVIHAGLYYPKDSLKEKFCAPGRKLLYDYCKKNFISHKKIGKLIVAVNNTEIEKLDNIKKQNSNIDLDWLSNSEITEMEPELNCKASLFSKETGIIDSHQYMLSLLGQAENNGATISYYSTVTAIHAENTSFDLQIECGQDQPFRLTSKAVINSAGLYAWDVAQTTYQQLGKSLPKRYLAKGNYFSYAKRCSFSHLIYPIPVDGGLGIHLTLDMAGDIKFGPDVEWITEINYETNEARKEDFLNAIKNYFPHISAQHLIPSYSGIRPRTNPPGEQNDFLIETLEKEGVNNFISLFGIESPGLTSSLPIAKHVTNLIKL
jgi:L-2-hydroxyglutarate oxidase LhgO